MLERKIKTHFPSSTCLLELCDIGLPSQRGGVYMLDTSQTQETLKRQNQVAIVLWNQVERPLQEVNTFDNSDSHLKH